MIIGTAGHIDHGKTTLIRALTGVDTDRLPDEKKRGISIDLGYAYIDTPNGERMGFIDVPGHERLVHTMVAGASGIDAVLLLVAADDGPMPQTQEHLAVLSLLGVQHGAIVITKTDRATAEQIETTRREMSALVAGTPLAHAPIFNVSAQSGHGIDALRHWLFETAKKHSQQHATNATQAFRLAIDRVFSLPGTGTVVTGTVHAGRIHTGDELVLLPSRRATQIRVRGIHAQDQPTSEAGVGERCALALTGIEVDAISRGQWLVAADAAVTSNRMDVQLTLWRGEPRVLRSGTHVQAHLGAARSNATVAVLDNDALAPGKSAMVQLVLAHELGAWHGERILLRDASGSRTIAGGVVLDPLAPTRHRRTPERRTALQAWTHDTAQQRLAALLHASPWGVDLVAFGAVQGLLADDAPATPPDTLRAPGYALGANAVEHIQTAVTHALQTHHRQYPDELGPDKARLRRLAAPRLPQPLWQALVNRWVKEQTIVMHGPVVHLPSHSAELSATEKRIADKAAATLMAAGFQGAWARDLARNANEPEPMVRTTLARLARRGELHQIVKDLYYPPETMEKSAQLVRQIAAKHQGQIVAAQFRDATQLGRKRAIQILEYFDRIGLTRRVGDTHILRSDSTLFDNQDHMAR